METMLNIEYLTSKDGEAIAVVIPITVEWIDKAEGDFTTVLRELGARKAPNKSSDLNQ